MGLAATTSGFSIGHGFWSGSPGLSAGMGVSGGGGIDPAGTAYFAAVAAAGGTISPARQVLYNNLFMSLRANGILPLLDRLWIFAAENSQTALIDLIALATATPVNGPTFLADRGYTSDTLTNYINSNYIPGTQFMLNSADIFVYANTNRAAGDGIVPFGQVSAGGVQTSMNIRAAAGTAVGVVNNVFGSGNTAGAVADALGLTLQSRTASNLTTGYRRTTALGTTTAAASVAIPAQALAILALNNNGVIGSFEGSRLAAVGAGAGFTAAQVLGFNTPLEVYLTAVGGNA